LNHDDSARTLLAQEISEFAVVDGHYLNGGTVCRRYKAKGDEKWKGGEELMDDFLRAVPKSALGW